MSKSMCAGSDLFLGKENAPHMVWGVREKLPAWFGGMEKLLA